MRLPRLLIGILLLASAAPRNADAQATATLRFSATAPDGSPVGGAAVRMWNLQTGFEREALTDSQGEALMMNIPPNTYEVAVESEDFAPYREVVSLRSNVPMRLDARLVLRSQLSSIEVAAEASITLIDEEATGTRNELNRAVIERLPNPVGARGLESLLLNFPGFAANANGAIHPRGAHNQMTYVIDGMPISDQFTGAFATSIDPSIVESLELYTGDVPAEFGSKVSGVANITSRSGFDDPRGFFGDAEIGGGGFDTFSSAVRMGGSRGRLGYFGAVSGVKSNRFLDSPSLDNLHNGGNAERAFTRFDYRWNDKTLLRWNAMAGRSSFQIANLRSQHAAGQGQRRLLRDAAGSFGLVRLISPSTTFDTTTSYRTTIAQLSPSAGDTPVTASLARRLSTFSSFNRLNVVKGRHTLRAGFDYQRFPVSENFFFGLTDPAFNTPSSPDFNPNLVPFDLSRGGRRFEFSDRGTGNLYTGFLQDRVRVGPWSFNLGARYDAYRFLVDGNQLQPRVGAAYRIDRTGTVLRVSYNRNYQTPPNENLLLSNSVESARLAPPDVQRELNGGVILMRPQRQNVYEAGLQQRLGDWAGLNVAVFHKDSSDLQDNDNFLDTGIIFPTSLAQSSVNGFETRLTVPRVGRFSGSMNLTHARVVVTPPFTGGLFLGSSALDDLSAGPFIIDHDQALSVGGNVVYRSRKNWWTSWRARFDSGLVSNPSDPAEVARDPDFFDQLPLVDLESDPPRVNGRTIIDAALGYERYRGDRRVWEFVLQVSNLIDQTALFNFQSVFVGTRVVQPRTVSFKIRRFW